MDSRRLVVWISTGVLVFQGTTLAFDLLNCSAAVLGVGERLPSLDGMRPGEVAEIRRGFVALGHVPSAQARLPS